MVACVSVLTGEVVMVKFALDCPAGTVTLAGACAAVLLLESVTTAPPVGAALIKFTVQVDVEPPATATGLSVMLLSPVDLPGSRAQPKVHKRLDAMHRRPSAGR
jgi:hypothetical protein